MTLTIKLQFPTADNTYITADTINFRADGSCLVNGGAAFVPHPGKLAGEIDIPTFVQYQYP
jgi:hypothetical protein